MKSVVLVIVFGVIALGVFSYFIFGLSQKAKPATILQPEEKMLMKDLKIETLQEGTGEKVKSGDIIVIHYKGTLEDGTQFDSSYDRGEPFETQIGVGKVIEGWDKGVVGMQVGERRKLTIPSSLGYGDQAIGDIPANSTLIFEVELVDIK